MAWPTRRDLWGPVFDDALAEYAAVANAIAEYEAVVMVRTPGMGDQTRRRLTRACAMTSYPNPYRANGAAIVPIGGVPGDDEALATIAAVLPGIDAIGVQTPTIAFGGGGPYCITQQLPALR